MAFGNGWVCFWRYKQTVGLPQAAHTTSITNDFRSRTYAGQSAYRLIGTKGTPGDKINQPANQGHAGDKGSRVNEKPIQACGKRDKYGNTIPTFSMCWGVLL